MKNYLFHNIINNYKNIIKYEKFWNKIKNQKINTYVFGGFKIISSDSLLKL